MTVIQINQWSCDICGIEVIQREEVCAYSDPVVSPPKGWDCMLEVPDSISVGDVIEACPTCASNPDWGKYVERQVSTR